MVVAATRTVAHATWPVAAGDTPRLPATGYSSSLPYRIDVDGAGDGALDRLVDLGALDAEFSADGGVAALMPDSVSPELVARALGAARLTVSPATGRDDDSVWMLTPRPVRIGQLQLVPVNAPAGPRSLRLMDSAAFGSGLHPTTALCLEALQDAIASDPPAALLDVGTGSGVLAIAALMLGTPRALATDIDEDALRVAAENARINGVADRLTLAHGGPEAVDGVWPLVVANVLAAPLIEMAPVLVRRLGHRGPPSPRLRRASRLVLSGIPSAVEADVSHAYRHLGLRHVRTTARAGWVALVLQASW
jgi:ribosomal protein L11 methyltransferase